ncbi:MAG: RdgB/HAM1 family non-canonical purine NTP pyrophosphatase [Candidatus Caenarcaniphilales bacterium]|nr:RdgB/HAM1 family non-canonical purine NTP pyrophosphatase [Candidatus Caenarcaniphilales bacterium]
MNKSLKEVPKEIILATTNKGKKSEFESLCEGTGILIKNIEQPFECEETGDSFIENATQKAKLAAKITRSYCIADDSGLCVESMNGEPGIYSARFFNNGAGMIKIIEALRNCVNRNAFFVCALVLASSEGRVLWQTEKKWEGTISQKPLGNNGFGYDPIFIPNGYSQTAGELDENVKKEISHRAKSILSFKEFFLSLNN